MGRFLPSHLSSLLAPATYPLLLRGYSICIDRGVSAANCKAGYILATCICVCVSIVFLAVCIHSAMVVARHLRRRRAQMDDRMESAKLWLPISNHVIDRAQFDRATAAVRAQFDAADERVGLLDMASPLDVRIASESIAILGGGPAVLAQLSHPYVAWAINEHSYTLDDTKRRFYNTFTNVFAMTFGTLSTAEKASRRVFATHLHVHGTIPQSVGVYRKGDRYSAGDEEAAIWVLATLIDYSLVMYELFVDELSDDEKERHYAFHKRVCGVWGIDAARLPPTFAEFMQYCSQMWHSDRLVVTSDATALADFLLRPLPWERALGINTYAHLTAYLLPTPMVRAYALGGLRSDDKSATLSTSSLSFWLMCAGIGVARVLYRSVPLSVRQFTGAAERAARKNGEPMRWYSRVAARIGTWFVHSVLSAENDSRFKQKIKKQT